MVQSERCSTKNSRDPAKIYLFKFNNKNSRKRCEICSKLTIKTPENVIEVVLLFFCVNFEYISHLFLVFLLLTLKKEILTRGMIY